MDRFGFLCFSKFSCNETVAYEGKMLCKKKKTQEKAGEMAQWLRALADLGVVPSTLIAPHHHV